MVLYANVNVEIFAVLGCYTACTGSQLPTFGDCVLVKGQTVQEELDQWVVLKRW
jgi:hypothetical protein